MSRKETKLNGYILPDSVKNDMRSVLNKTRRDENGKIIKYGEMTLDLLEDNIKRDIINLNGIHNKRCEFVEAREGLEALFGREEVEQRSDVQ